MSKSAHLRLADLRAIIRLVGDCRDLGDDGLTWRRHAFAELGRLVGADFGIGGEVAGLTGSRFQPLGIMEWGWDRGFPEAAWQWGKREFARDPNYCVQTRTYFDRLRKADGDCVSRTDMIGDADWYHSVDYERVHAPIGIDHGLWCFRSVAGDLAGEVGGMFLGRCRGQADFRPRDRVIVREAHAALAPLLGGPLARLNEPSPVDLPPRCREVLRCFLQGDSDRQVAARLKISPHTVNQYAKHLFRHFRVASRTELLALWVRRRWRVPAAWTR